MPRHSKTIICGWLSVFLPVTIYKKNTYMFMTVIIVSTPSQWQDTSRYHLRYRVKQIPESSTTGLRFLKVGNSRKTWISRGWKLTSWICDSSMQKEKVPNIFSPNIGETWWFNMVFQVFKQSPFSNNPVVIMAKLGDKFRLPVSFWGSSSRRRAASEFGLLFAAFCWG